MYPILFEFGIITIFSLWFFVTIGFVAAALLFTRLAKRLRVKIDLIAGNSIMLFVITLVSSRIFFMVTHYERFFTGFKLSVFTSFFTIWDKGLSFWGAVAGWTLGLLLIAKKSRESREAVLKITDMLIPAVLFGMFFGAIGALLEGINYGKPTTLPWGITFRSANVKYITALHPTQIFAALYCLGISLILVYALYRLRGRIPGLITRAGIFLFSAAKVIEELFRGDDALMLGLIRISLIISLAFLGFSAYTLYATYTNKNGEDNDGLLKSWTWLLKKRIISLLRRKKDSQEISQNQRLPQNQIAQVNLLELP